MLMHNKLEPEMIVADLKLDLTPAYPPQNAEAEVDDDVNTKRKQLWEIIVRMHYLSHELRDPDLELSVSPAFTRLVSGLLSEWAVMAEEAANTADEGLMPLHSRVDHH
jgi:hypothetical protein